MKLNVGNPDRIIRVILAVLLIVLGLTGILSGPLAIIGYGLSVVLLVTAAIGFCPLYALFRLNTSKA